MGPLQVDVSYGIQICGIYSPSRMHSPFQIVPVIPFRCSRCHKSHLSNEQSDQKCVDCVKVEQEEDPQSPEGQAMPEPLARGVVNTQPGRGCASRNVSATHYISLVLQVWSADKSESIEDITAFNSTSGNYSAQKWHSKIRHSLPLVKDLRAIYDDKSRLLKLYSKEIADLLKRKENAYPIYDKLYLEFGELLTTAQEPIAFGLTIFCFNTWRRRRQRRRLRSYAANHHSTGSALGRKSLYLNGGGARALGTGFLPTISQPTTAITSLGQPPQGAFTQSTRVVFTLQEGA
uniref:Fibronectin type-III domain-containing protein n=1 Tax=Ditylenchus dipsaci TaxID=166011 RepID=A0A915DR70_9BILA